MNTQNKILLLVATIIALVFVGCTTTTLDLPKVEYEQTNK